MYPCFGVPGELFDRVWERAFDEVGEGYGLQDCAEVSADGDPDLRERPGGAPVLDGLGELAPDVGQRPFDGADDVGQRDLVCGPGEPVAAGGTRWVRTIPGA